MTSSINPSVTGSSNAAAITQPDINNQPDAQEAKPADSYYDSFATTRSGASNDATYNVSGSNINPAANRNNVLLAQNNATNQAPSANIDKGQNGRNFNRIQVPNPSNDPAKTQLNQKLNNIYQSSYAKPLQSAIADFKRTTGTTAGATGGGFGLSAIWNKLVSGASNIPGTIAGIVANLGASYAGGNSLSDKVTAATTDYLQKANNELTKAGYAPVKHL